MKYFDKEEYDKAKRNARRGFWSGVVLVVIGGIIAAATLGRIVSQEQERENREYKETDEEPTN